jgi:hypothetical protein
VRGPKTKFGFVLFGVKVVDFSSGVTHRTFDLDWSNIFDLTVCSEMNAQRFSVGNALVTDEAMDNVPYTTNERQLLFVVFEVDDEDAGFPVGSVLLSTKRNDGSFDLGERETQRLI